MGGEAAKELLFLLVVKIGLLDRAAAIADRAETAARRVGSDLMGLEIGLLANFQGLEIGRNRVAGIRKHQRLLTIANNDPVALMNPQHASVSLRCNEFFARTL